GRATMHMTPALFALFQNWSLHQLNANGAAVELDPEVIDLLDTSTEDEYDRHTTGHHHQDDPGDQPTTADTFNDLNELKTEPHPDATAEDADGNTISADQAAGVDELTTGQRLAAIVLGMFQTILTMDPSELGTKSAHGTSAQLMIIQDIQTAYHTLGFGALTETLRRTPDP